jgi:hypothetical protein
LEWADIDAVTLDQATSTAQAFAIDIGTVGASEVAQHDGSIRYLKRSVTARDIRMIKDYLPWYRLAADGQTVVEEDPVTHGGKPATLICLHYPHPQPSQWRSTSPFRGASTPLSSQA